MPNKHVVAWKDNKVVTMASNAYGINPVTRVNRIVTVSHKRRKIKCPKIVNMYNSYMGRVDRFNQYVHSQSKKWWCPLFAFGLDASCQNAWQIYKRGNNTNILYCEYRRHILLSSLGRFKIPA